MFFGARKLSWWRSMTRELRHHFWEATILVRHLGLLDFSKTSKNVKIDQKLIEVIKTKWYKNVKITKKTGNLQDE